MKQNKVFKILVCMLALIMAMSATSLTSLAAIWTGEISTVTPSRTVDGFYLIQTAEDLAWFATQVNSDAGNVTIKAKLTDDIYLNNVEEDDYSRIWTPIANYSETGRVFSGIFDGNGFTIYGMKVESTNDYQGLFGYLYGAQIRNVKIDKSYVTGGDNVGGIAGYSDNRTSIVSSSVNAEIRGANNVGGITGYLLTGGNISYSCFNGSIDATGHRVGGITGCAFSESTISQSYNKATVFTLGKYVGGIVGTNSGSLILSCYNTGDIYGDIRVGGISGNNVGDISSCYNASDVQSISQPAGLVGAIAAFYYSSKISNCYYDSELYTGKEDNAIPYATDEMKRHAFVDVLNGSLNDYYYDFLQANEGYPILSWQVDQNLWDGSMSEPEMSLEGDYYYITTPRELAWFAALVNGTLPDGQQNAAANAILSNSIVLNVGNLGEGSNIWTPIGSDGVEYSGNFYGSGYTIRGMYIPEGSYVGLFGQISASALISNVTVAESYVNGESCVGPVVGISFGQVERVKVIYTEVIGVNCVGGIVGENWGSIIDSSSIYSDISGAEYVGGVAGVNNDGSSLEVCCSFNTVTGDNHVGGIVGDNMADIRSTFNVGSVTAVNSYAGGISGRLNACSLADCYNTGDITADSMVGGITGVLEAGASVESSYSIGKVTGNDYANAVIGALFNGTVSGCYYDRNKVTNNAGNAVTDKYANALRTTQMTGSNSLVRMDALSDTSWVASDDSEFFIYYPQLQRFANSADYDLYDVSLESVSFLKDGLICKVITNTETAYYKTLGEAFDKIGSGTGTVELMDKITISSTATVTGNVTVIPTVETNIILRSKSFFDKPIIVKNGATLELGASDASYATLTVDGNDVTDVLGETFAESMITVEKGGTLNFNDAIATRHTALNGGFISNSGTVNLYSGSISGCTAFQAGGVVYNKGELNIHATEFDNNNSKLYGGVLFNAGGNVTVNTGTDFSNNTAGEGGVMYVGGGTVNLLGGSLYSNTATSFGGAVYVHNNGKLKLYDGTIYDNSAGISGSGIYTTGTVEFYASGSVDLSNDVYLPTGKTITMAAKSVYSSPIVKITPDSYEEGLSVIAGDYTAMNAVLCTVTPEGETPWHVNSGGRLTSSEIKYVLTASFFTSDTVPYTSIEEALEDIGENPAIITLLEDITVSETIVIKSNITLESDGIAHTISASEGFDGPLFNVINGATLSFGSEGDNYTGDVLYINGTNVTGDAIVDASDGSVKICSGTVIFGANNIESAVKSENLIEMYGGKITENNVTVGAVYLADGTFNFFAGTIFDNNNVGVYSNGTFNILDGAYVDESNIVYITDGHVINVVTPEPEIDEETGEEIPVEITMPEKIAHIDFEKYYVDTQIINTEKSDDAGKYAGKFTVVDTTYTLDELNYLRADNFVLKKNATIKLRENVCVYGFTLGVYTAKGLELQFENENIAVIDKDGNFRADDEMVGTSDNVVLLDGNGTIYRMIPILIYGDVNTDGQVDGQDAFIVSMYINGFFSQDEFTIAHLEAMDVNHDGQVTQEDVEIIEKMGVFEGDIEQQMNW